MFKVSISKHENVIFCVGTDIDFVGCMTNPKSCNRYCGKCTIKTLKMSGPTTNHHPHKQMILNQVQVERQIQV